MLEYYILRPEPLIDQLNWRALWVPALILLIFTGFLEELIFRGALQYTALRRFGRFGMWYVAAVFAVLHLGYRSVLDVVFVFAVAAFFGWVVMKTGSIVGVSLSHGLTNIALYLIVPFLLAAPPGTNSYAPKEIPVPLPSQVGPTLPSQAGITPFKPLPTATYTSLPINTPVASSSTPLPPIQTLLSYVATEVPTDTPQPSATKPYPATTSTEVAIPPTEIEPSPTTIP